MTELVVGCKALVINANVPENIGKVVTCVRYYPPGETVRFWLPFYKHYHLMAAKDAPAQWSVLGQLTTAVFKDLTLVVKTDIEVHNDSLVFEADATFPEHWLMRIDGEDSLFEREESRSWTVKNIYPIES